MSFKKPARLIIFTSFIILVSIFFRVTTAFAYWPSSRANAQLTGCSVSNGPSGNLSINWQSNMDASVASRLVVDENGDVYFIQKGENGSAALIGLNADDGTEKLRYQFELNYEPSYLSNSLLIAGDIIYFIGTEISTSTKTTETHLKAIGINKNNGSLITEIPLDNITSAGSVSVSSLNYYEETLLVQTAISSSTGEKTGSLYAISNNAIAWSFSNVSETPPIAIDGTVITEKNNEIYALGIKTGESLDHQSFYDKKIASWVIYQNPAGEDFLCVFTADNYYYVVKVENSLTSSGNSSVNLYPTSLYDNSYITKIDSITSLPILINGNLYYRSAPADSDAYGVITSISYDGQFKENKYYFVTEPLTTLSGDINGNLTLNIDSTLYLYNNGLSNEIDNLSLGNGVSYPLDIAIGNRSLYVSTYGFDINNGAIVYGITKLSDGDNNLDLKNSAPQIISAPTDTNVESGGSFNLAISAFDADGDSLSLEVNTSLPGVTFTAEAKGAGIWTWTSNTITPTEVGTYSATFKVFEVADENSTAETSCTITVFQPNQTPVFDNLEDQTIDAGSELTFTVSASDADGDTITYSMQAIGDEMTGATLDASTGVFAVTPTEDQAGKTFYIQFYATDDEGAQDSTYAKITVNEMSTSNNSPVVDAIDDVTVPAGETISITVNATDPEEEVCSFTVIGLSDGATFESNTISWTPTVDDLGSYTITVHASDPEGNYGRTSFTITVIEGEVEEQENHSPTISNINNQSVNINSPLSITDITIADEDGDELTIEANLPSWATLSETADGIYEITGTPTETAISACNITVSDPDGLSDTASFYIEAYDNNRSPSIDEVSDQEITVGETLTFDVTGSDADGDHLTLSCSFQEEGVNFATSAADGKVSGTFSWTPTPDQTGTYTNVVFSVSDGEISAVDNITITVINNNLGPVFNAMDTQTGTVGELLTFTVSATDANEDALTYSSTYLPDGATFSGATFSWTPDEPGIYYAIFEVTDGEETDTLVGKIEIEEAATVTTTAADVELETTLLVNGTIGSNDWYVSSTSISFSNKVNEATVYYRIDNGALSVYETTAVALAEGEHEITYFAEYNGEIETAKTKTVKIDYTAPTITVSDPDGKEISSGSNQTLTWGKEFTIATNNADETSGINSLTIAHEANEVEIQTRDLTADITDSIVNSYVTDGEIVYALSTENALTTTSFSRNEEIPVTITCTDNAGNTTATTFTMSFTAAAGEVVNYPNPVNPLTGNITFNLTKVVDGELKLIVYDSVGRTVYTYVNNYSTGPVDIVWDCTDNFGRKLGSGLYFYRVITDNQSYKGKILTIVQ